MKPRPLILSCFLFVAVCAHAQSLGENFAKNPDHQNLIQQEPDQQKIDVPKGQAVPLRLLQTLSSDTGLTGDVLALEAAEDVVVDGRVLIRQGAPAAGVVEKASKKAKRGPGGRLLLHITNVTMANGAPLLLNTTRKAGGGGVGKKTYTGLVIASAVLLSPAGTAFVLLDHGEEVAFPAGTRLVGFVPEDVFLDSTPYPVANRGVASAPANLNEPPTKLPEELATLQVSTTAADGSVWVDGTFRGEAPLTLDLKPGVHRFKVVKDGYREWKEHVIVDGKALRVEVTLQKHASARSRSDKDAMLGQTGRPDAPVQ